MHLSRRPCAFYLISLRILTMKSKHQAFYMIIIGDFNKYLKPFIPWMHFYSIMGYGCCNFILKHNYISIIDYLFFMPWYNCNSALFPANRLLRNIWRTYKDKRDFSPCYSSCKILQLSPCCKRKSFQPNENQICICQKNK